MFGKNKKYKISCNGLSEEEAKFARALFEQYLSHYHVESFSELRLCEELVYRETQQESFKKLEKLDTEAKEAKGKKKLFNQFGNSMDENLKQMLLLREKLGLLNNEQRQDPFTYMQTLEKKFKIWQSQNQESCTRACPNCSKIIMFNMDMTKWEVKKHPFYNGKTLYMEHMWKLWQEGKITKEEIATCLQVSPDYVEWCAERFGRIE